MRRAAGERWRQNRKEQRAPAEAKDQEKTFKEEEKYVFAVIGACKRAASIEDLIPLSDTQRWVCSRLRDLERQSCFYEM